MTSSTNNFTAADIERYYSGKMSAEERHALEKAALDDPFLADALEGYAFTSTPADDLSAIKARLQEKTQRKKPVGVISLYKWLRVAAIFIILAGAGWFAYKNSQSQKSEIAQEKNSPLQDAGSQTQTTQSKPANKADSIQNNNYNGLVSTESAAFSKKRFSNEDSYSPHKDVATKNKQKNYLASGVDEEKVAALKKPAVQNSMAVRRQNNSINIKNDSAIAFYNAGVFNNNTKYIQTYPNVAISSTRNDSTSLEKKDAFARKVAGINKPDTLKDFDIVLQPQQVPMNEVVIVDKNPNKKSSGYPMVIVDTLEPAEGYVKFDDYIANNIRMPDEIRTKVLSGEVQLAFEVDKNGQPTNITVVKSLCDKCDEEAIRLLKEGPKWKKKKNRKGKITIKFPPNP
jgi:TonB family protein